MSYIFGPEVAGGWNAWKNIELAQEPTSYQPSGFFPAQQRELVINLPIEPRGAGGLLVPPVDPGIPSFQDFDWQLYESSAFKAAETKGLADVIGGTGEFIGGAISDIYSGLERGLDWAMGTKESPGVAVKVKTLWDIFSGDYGARQPIVQGSEQPGKTYSTEQHYNDLTNMAAATYSAIGGMLTQVKGLFSRGYPQYSSQPTRASTAGGMLGDVSGIVLVAIAGVIIWWLVKKK